MLFSFAVALKVWRCRFKVQCVTPATGLQPWRPAWLSFLNAAQYFVSCLVQWSCFISAPLISVVVNLLCCKYLQRSTQTLLITSASCGSLVNMLIPRHGPTTQHTLSHVKAVISSFTSLRLRIFWIFWTTSDFIGFWLIVTLCTFCTAPHQAKGWVSHLECDAKGNMGLVYWWAWA